MVDSCYVEVLLRNKTHFESLGFGKTTLSRDTPYCTSPCGPEPLGDAFNQDLSHWVTTLMSLEVCEATWLGLVCWDGKRLPMLATCGFSFDI